MNNSNSKSNNYTQLQTHNTILQGYKENPQEIEKIRDPIYKFFENRITKDSPYTLLDSFYRMFIIQDETVNQDCHHALYTLSMLSQFGDKQEEYFIILEKCCYILLKEWIKKKEYKYILRLRQLFAEEFPITDQTSLVEVTVKNWLNNFKLSKNFANINFLISKCDFNKKKNWTDYFAVYPLIEQSLNPDKSEDQRQIAGILAQQIQQKFSLQLKMYMARSQWSYSPTNSKMWEKPTKIDDQRLRLIEKIIVKKKGFGYHNIANIFLKQTEDLKYAAFKTSFLKYLLYSFETSKSENIQLLYQKIQKQLQGIYIEENNNIVNELLILQTCNAILAYLVDPRNPINPNHPVTVLLNKNDYLVLSIILLKIILICPESYNYLMCRLASFIYNYQNTPPNDCAWLIGFLETFKVVLAFGLEEKIERRSKKEKTTPSNDFGIGDQTLNKNDV
jgi:hypothetical protein